MLTRVNQAQQEELVSGELAEEPLVELGHSDEEGHDIEGIRENDGDEEDGELEDDASG